MYFYGPWKMSPYRTRTKNVLTQNNNWRKLKIIPWQSLPTIIPRTVTSGIKCIYKNYLLKHLLVEYNMKMKFSSKPKSCCFLLMNSIRKNNRLQIILWTSSTFSFLWSNYYVIIITILYAMRTLRLRVGSL